MGALSNEVIEIVAARFSSSDDCSTEALFPTLYEHGDATPDLADIGVGARGSGHTLLEAYAVRLEEASRNHSLEREVHVLRNVAHRFRDDLGIQLRDDHADDVAARVEQRTS